MRSIDLGHIAWAKAVDGHHRYSLASSTLSAPDLAALGLPAHGELPAGDWSKLPALEAALAERYAAPGGRVLITAGGSEANAAVFAGVLEPGDEVLVERPGYEPHRGVPALFGATVRTFDRQGTNGFGGFIEAVEARLGERTRMVVVSHQHNPSGAPLAPDDAVALGELAERKNLYVLCDEAFHDAEPGSLACLAARGPRWITTASLTKAYGLEGLRIGWVAADAQVLEHCAAGQNALSADVSMPSVALALALVPHLDTLRERGHAIVAKNRARWKAWLDRAQLPPDFETYATPNGIPVWCRIGDGDAGDALAAFAARSFSLAVTPGRFFADPSGIRVSLGGDPARFAEALERFDAALQAFSKSQAETGGRS